MMVVGVPISAAKRLACTGACAPKGHQDKIIGVITALDGNETEGVGHRGIGNFHDAVSPFDDLHPQRLGTFLLYRMTGGFDIKLNFSA